jgi:hypothetical protein
LQQHAQSAEVIEMAMGDVDRREVAVMQGDPVGKRFSLATVMSVSTRTASCSPKINVEVLGSNAGGGPNGRTRSATIAFSGAVKTLTLSAAAM